MHFPELRDLVVGSKPIEAGKDDDEENDRQWVKNKGLTRVTLHPDTHFTHDPASLAECFTDTNCDKADLKRRLFLPGIPKEKSSSEKARTEQAEAQRSSLMFRKSPVDPSHNGAEGRVCATAGNFSACSEFLKFGFSDAQILSRDLD